MDPKAALQRLKDGNVRFTAGVRSVAPMLGHMKMPELAKTGQKPFAIVLTCSDSRSPAELIFDEGLGELFVVRVAGNVVAPSLLASMEFAALNFGSSIVLVLGHTQCGAIKAAYDHVKNPEAELPSANLEELVGRIRPAVRRAIRKQRQQDESMTLEACGEENIRRSLAQISEQSPILAALAKERRLSIVGATLELATGKVKFLE